MTRARGIGGALLAAALAGGGLWTWYAQVASELAQPFDRHGAAFAGSHACESCHADRHASWYRTWHRTMTQEATSKSVQGHFDGKIVDQWGSPIRPLQENGRYYFEYLDEDTRQPIARLEITRTVGSHRYQQYLAQAPATGDNYHRLHLLWSNEDQRWVHMNGVFLFDDHQDFDQHVTTWNHNCIFCHNTGPQPRIRNAAELYQRIARGEPVDFLEAARYESTVAELGIACESCHGPGAEHARRNRSMMRRYVLHSGAFADPTIVNPRKLDAVRSAYVCGQCHAQRVPVSLDLVETWLTTGPTYRAGDDLTQHVRLVTRDEPGPANNPDLYRLRFWNDGTPRLSAYELTGLMQSKCFTRGGVTCIDCHAAHGGDVNAMMRDDGRTNAPCAKCHAAIAAKVSTHTHHRAESSGSLCSNCHMPKMVYGVMEIHRSHRIEVPDPQASAAGGRPDACTGCHLDRSASWAAARIASPDGERDDAGLPENTRQLFGGDPVQRAVAARLAGRDDSPLETGARAALIPALIEALDDGYPAVRRFASHSLQRIDAATSAGLADTLARFDFVGAPAPRAAVVDELRELWRGHHGAAPASFDPALLAQLRAQARAQDQTINIGE